ncbi:MAG TPA: BtpA/SgcQ family protein [Chthoniobacterales bacterium]|jgi:hypothetical protein
MRLLHPSWDFSHPVVIGMLHLPPLPGAPLSRMQFRDVQDAVLRDAVALAKGGVDGLMMENFGDVPFLPGRVSATTVAHMTALACAVRKEVEPPLGINVLRNDGSSALAIAHATGANFIRVNVLCGARVTDQGLIQGIAHELLRERAILGADDVKILADVDVKHSAPLAERPLEDEVEDLIHRALADAVIVSGAGTGKATDPEMVRRVKEAAGETPVLVGSGVTSQTAGTLRDYADGFIIGTAFKKDGVATNAVELERVTSLMRAIR